VEKSGRSDILVEFSQRFGMIAVSRGYITPRQLKEALTEQVDDDLACRSHRLLGTIFFEKKQMKLIQIDQVLDELVMGKIKRKRAVSKKKKIRGPKKPSAAVRVP
jgi:hypothetical protein